MDNTHEILLVVPENMPDLMIEDFITEIKEGPLSPKVAKRPFSPHASLDWAIPGLISAYIAKPYFEAFLKKAGDDHYGMLKKWLQSLVVKARLAKAISIDQSTEKIDKDTVSKSLSVFLPAKEGHVVKVLFDEQLSAEEWQHFIGLMLNVVVEHHCNNSSTDVLTMHIANNADEVKTLFACYDKGQGTIKIISTNEMIQMKYKEWKEKKS